MIEIEKGYVKKEDGTIDVSLFWNNIEDMYQINTDKAMNRLGELMAYHVDDEGNVEMGNVVTGTIEDNDLCDIEKSLALMVITGMQFITNMG